MNQQFSYDGKSNGVNTWHPFFWARWLVSICSLAVATVEEFQETTDPRNKPTARAVAFKQQRREAITTETLRYA